jgi:predicted amidohydrolase
MHLRVAGAQLPVTADVKTNVEAICRAIAWSEAQGADILLTPEGSLSGYTATFDADEVREGLAEVTEAARRAHVGLALGTCFIELDDGGCYNQIRFYEPDGTYLGFHSKTLRCGSLDDPPRGEINRYAVRPLRTFCFQGVTIGGLICNDMWANPECTPQPDPHLSQRLSEMGARIILHAVNGGRDGSDWSDVAWRYHEANLRMRARAGRLWIVTVDSCYPPSLKCSAPSGVVAPDGTWACQADPWGEQYFVHDIELSE